jgi:hypothetical protein
MKKFKIYLMQPVWNWIQLWKFPVLCLQKLRILIWMEVDAFQSMPIFLSLPAGITLVRIKVRELTIKRTKAEGEIKLNAKRSLLEYNFWIKQALREKLLEKTDTMIKLILI